MKRLLIISQHYPPEIGAASNRMDHVVRHLLKNNFEIYLVTSKPNYPNPSLYKSVKYDDNLSNLKVYRSPIFTVSISEKASRLLNQVIFLIYAIVISLFICVRFSIKSCLTTSPPFLINFVGFLMKKFLGIKWTMEVRDLWPDSMVAVKAMEPSTLIYRLLKKLEKLFYKSSDRIIVVTKSTKEILISNDIPEKKVHIITNGIPDWAKLPETLNIRNINKKDPLNVIYIGNIGFSQGLGQILDVAEQLNDYTNIHFYFVGEGLDKKNLLKMSIEKGLLNVHFIKGITDKKELFYWYSKADLGIVSLKESELFKSVIPSKIFEYAAMKVPILFIGSGEAAKLIRGFELGYVVSSGYQLKHQIIDLYQQKLDFPTSFSEEHNHFLNKYSWKNLIKKYIEVFEVV